MKTQEEVKDLLSKHDVVVCDTTLRDGEQTAGIVFSNLEKYRIAQLLDDAGVQQIEAGIPTMGDDEVVAVIGRNDQGCLIVLLARSRPGYAYPAPGLLGP